MDSPDSHLPPLPPAVIGRPISNNPLQAVPWDQNCGSWLSRWWETLLMVLFRPGEFFAALRDGGRLDRAIIFFTICLLVMSVVAPLTVGQVETRIFGSVFDRLMRGMPLATEFNVMDSNGELDLGPLLPTGAIDRPGKQSSSDPSQESARDPVKELLPALMRILSVVSSALSILLGFAGLFVTAALFQAGAWIFIPHRRPFGDTLRAVAYAHAPLVCFMVPIVGELIFVVWFSVLLVIGLRVLHGTTKSRVVAALSFWPTVVLLVLAGGCLLVVRQLTAGL